jgi:hypothetical protein
MFQRYFENEPHPSQKNGLEIQEEENKESLLSLIKSADWKFN